MTRPPLPPFDDASARIKVRLAEDAWNSREPERVSLAYTPESQWRNRAENFAGRDRIVDFLTRKWAREHDYRLIKELWAYHVNRIVAFDSNCPQHIPVRLTDAERDDEIAHLYERITKLERELARNTALQHEVSA